MRRCPGECSEDSEEGGGTKGEEGKGEKTQNAGASAFVVFIEQIEREMAGAQPRQIEDARPLHIGLVSRLVSFFLALWRVWIFHHFFAICDRLFAERARRAQERGQGLPR